MAEKPSFPALSATFGDDFTHVPDRPLHRVDIRRLVSVRLDDHRPVKPALLQLAKQGSEVKLPFTRQADIPACVTVEDMHVPDMRPHFTDNVHRVNMAAPCLLQVKHKARTRHPRTNLSEIFYTRYGAVVNILPQDFHPARMRHIPHRAETFLQQADFIQRDSAHDRYRPMEHIVFCAQRLSCRTAAASSSPYRVTLDEGKWNGRDTYSKWAGDAAGFGSQIQVEDGADRIYHHFCPVVLLLCITYSLYTTFTRTEAALWCASAVFTAAAAFGAALSYGRSFHLCARRLAHSGAALAGWPGIVGSRRADRVLITDTDLFPPGYVELNGFKVLGDFPMERVVAYTATMIRDSGSGLSKLFHDYLRTLGGLMRNSERLCCYEGGGLSATIRGDQVLVGSAAFMNLMEITLPAGLNVKSAVFCAINGELAGIFALSYNLPDTVFPSIEELMGEKVGPVLATRDFNLIPAMLQQRFKLAADKMDFPPVERRRELSDPDQPHSQRLTAVLCREGLFPFAEAVTGAKRLRWATRLGAVICCVSSVLGLVLTSYLVSMAAFGSLSPLNLLIYMVTWLAPVWFLSGWVHRF